MHTNTIRTNSLKAWVLASRPKTLSGAAVPVMVALSQTIARGDALVWRPALLCLLFALVMQIDANFVNDYFDCIKGVDGENRLGPKRACAQGWVSLKAMRIAILITTLLACAIGLPLIHRGGLMMVAVGISCVVFCFLYTTLLSRLGLGDVLVVVFFGLIPVCTTYYIQTYLVDTNIICLALACGLVTDCLLIVNNYRDRDTDYQAGKRTLVTFIGANATEWLYLIMGIVACALTIIPLQEKSVWMLLWLGGVHIGTWLQMEKNASAETLNAMLGRTAGNILLFGLLLCVIILF